jgi:hypothetical protein
MHQQWDFFKQGETSFGSFYPLHYIVAGYGDLAGARAAEEAFRNSGVAAADVRATDGEFVTEELESRHDRSAVDKVANEIVDFVGTEKHFIERDREHAAAGGAFLFVFAPEDEDAANAKAVFVQHPPVYARRYLRPAIEVMFGQPEALGRTR